IYGLVDDDIYAAKVKLPKLLLDTYKDKTGYVPRPVNTPAPVVKQATPDSGIKVNGIVLSTPAELATPESAPTPTPTPVPTPAPTPVPIELPEIKDAAYAEVFYNPNGTWYHAKKNCQNMVNAVSHTLEEAAKAGKKVCDVCGVTPFSMMDCENYLWTDTRGYAHTTDECASFAEGRYTIVPFEDVYSGSYKYCDACNADTCYLYMRQNDAMYIAESQIIDEQMMALYDYEKTITVYYGENSRKYHRTAECQYMNKDIYKHTLYQALHVDMKQICTLCNPLTEAEALEQMSASK
ncbi:MAG: hypothetical protein IJC48_09590, partial [Clostridia bacterium]|nr:hypothetical protein [Clostridia bacterium]